jgi:hypothetical protein
MASATEQFHAMPDAAQPTAESDEKKSRSLGSYVLWAFVAVMVYFLSAGPVVMITKGAGNRTNAVISYIYYPWVVACFHTPLRTPMGLYMHIWVPSIWNKDGEFLGGWLGLSPDPVKIDA